MNVRRSNAVALTLAMLLFAASTAAQTNYHLTPVVRSFQSAPVGAQLGAVRTPSINARGQIAYEGDGAVFLMEHNSTRIIAAMDDPAPGGGKFIAAKSPFINNSGRVVFRGEVTRPSVSGVFLYSGGTISQLLADGSRAATGEVFFPDAPSINAAGDVAFTDLNTSALFLLTRGVVSKVAAPGDSSLDGGTFDFILPSAVNSSGQVAFVGFQPTGIDGVYLASGGTITKLVSDDDVLPDGSLFQGTLGTAPSLNDLGVVAFAGFSDLPNVFLYSNGQLTIGVPQPSAADLITPAFVSLNNAGQIVFNGSQAGRAPGEFLFSNGTLSILVGPPQISPEGETFTDGLAPVISNAGRVVFVARTDVHNNTLYAYSSGQITRVGGQGDVIARSPRFQFPTPAGLGLNQVLISSQTFPGGLGAYTVPLTGPDDDPQLFAHIGQLIGERGVISNFNNLAMNSSDQAVYSARLSNFDSSVVLKSGSSITEIAHGSLPFFGLVGDPAPGGGNFVLFRWASLNNLGQVAISGFARGNQIFLYGNGQITQAALVRGPSLTNAVNDLGLIVDSGPVAVRLVDGGIVTNIASFGDALPGGGTFLPNLSPRSAPVINNNGDVVFAGFISTSPTVDPGTGLFLFSGGILSRIAGPGDPSPDGGAFIAADAPSINNAGQIVFAGKTTVGSGIFLFGGGQITSVALPGDSVPGDATLLHADLPKINDLGQIVFGAGLSTGEGVVFLASLVPVAAADGAGTAGGACASSPQTPNRPTSGSSGDFEL